MKQQLSIVLACLFFVLNACTNSTEQSASHETESGVIVNNFDSLETGRPVPARFIHPSVNQPNYSVKAGEPTRVEDNRNVIPIQSPDIQLVGEDLVTLIPGKDSTLLPIETLPNGIEQNLVFPQRTEALSPETMDAAYYNIQFLDVDQGLSSSYVIDITQDSRGNLWVATWASGACMYNGKSFTNYNTNSGLCSNYIWCIFEDSEGNIWFGSDGVGVSKYDGNTFTTYTEKDGLAGNLVRKIVEDDRNNLWFATNNGLTKFDGRHFYTYRKEQGLGGNDVHDIYKGANNRLLISTENGFSIFDGVLFTHYSEKDGLLSNETTAIYEDDRENIWIGSADQGICMFDGYTFFSFNTTHGLTDNSITDILEDDYGHIWIGTANNGVCMYNRASFTQITRAEGLSSNSVQAIYQDESRNLWFGTYAGLNKYNERSFTNYTEEQGLGGSIIRGICEDQYGNLWFGHSNGVSKYDGHVFERYGKEQGLSDHFIRTILQDAKGNLWFATNGGGAIYYDGTYFTHFTSENGLSGDIILTIYEDDEENIWFGTYGSGATKYDGEKFYHLTDAGGGLLDNTVRAICQDDQGNMWFGTNGGGLACFNGESIVNYTTNEGLSGNTILSLLTDTKGNLWIGTEGAGINVYSNGSFVPISSKDGLCNDIVWSLVEDYEHNIWAGTEKGLNLIEIQDSSSFTISNYGKLDGLKGIDFYPNSVYLDSDNRMWWGTGKALSMLDLDKFKHESAAPKISFTDISLDQSFIDYRKLKNAVDSHTGYQVDNISFSQLEQVKYDSILKFSNSPSNLEIPYNLNHLTFHFSANDWTAPHKIKYYYQLQGTDSEWHQLDNDNKVVFSYLPEGRYVFNLKAKSERGEWSETLSFNLTIHPPWWRTVWAYLSYILLAALIIILVTAVRTKNLIHQRKLLEKLVDVRTEELVRQKELVELKNKEIIDSITYAKRIQRAILPSSGMVKRKLANAFILFKPKDIVAGDFYWLEEKDDTILLAAADCTGHGVPGAMVSLVCNNTLSRTVREFNLTEPDKILNKVRDIVIESFTNSREEVKDGMDISLISLDINTNKLRYSGANNNLYIISKGELTILKADRQPIGKYVISHDFNVQEVQLHPGDTFYLFTDGYIDQFGGPNGKKFKSKKFLKMLVEIQHLTMREQKRHLEKVFDEWKDRLDQVDDICIIGVRI